MTSVSRRSSFNYHLSNQHHFPVCKKAWNHITLLQICIETFELIKSSHHLAKILQKLILVHAISKLDYFIILLFADKLFQLLKGQSIYLRNQVLFRDTFGPEYLAPSIGQLAHYW